MESVPVFSTMSDMIKPMAHQEAEIMRAVDLYLLNELTEEERRRFEEHYFDCATCAEAVEAGQTFVRGIRPVPEAVPWPKSLLARLGKPQLVPAWRQWVYGGVTALSLIAVGWQHFYPVFAKKAQANTVIQARELEKGEDSEKAYTLRTPSATVEINLPLDAEFPLYRVVIEGDHAKPLLQTVVAPARESDRRLSVQIAPDSLGSGRFTVNVEGLHNIQAKDGSKVGQYYFVVKN